MKNAKINNTAAILAAIQANNYRVYDDHANSGHSFYAPAVNFVEYTRNGKAYVCMVIPGTVCSLNPVYIADDGTVHLDQWSVGGTFDARTESVSEAAQTLNKLYTDPQWTTGECITAVFTFTLDTCAA